MDGIAPARVVRAGFAARATGVLARHGAAVGLLVVLLPLPACTSVSGLNDYSLSVCKTCGDRGRSAADGTAEDATAGDSAAVDGTTGEDALPSDAPAGPDGGGALDGADAPEGASCPAPCSGSTPFCDPTTLTCVACTGESGCRSLGDGSVPACCAGACVDTATSVAHCGSCGHACATANVQTATCAGARCGYTACKGGYGDCDGDPTNGCETNLATNPTHCGACTNACSSGLCGTTIAGWGTSPALWQLNGSASIAAGQFGAQTGILTTATGGMVGTMVYKNPIATDSFTASFSIYIGGGTGSDGMGFMLQTTGATALGGGGGCLGMCGLAGYGVEFDTWNNSACGDTNANHVAVDNLTTCNTFPTTLRANNNLPFMFVAGGTHAVVVQLASGAISVSLDGTSYLSSVALPGFTAGTAYYYGFAAATGGSTDFHEVSPQATITFPTPRCL